MIVENFNINNLNNNLENDINNNSLDSIGLISFKNPSSLNNNNRGSKESFPNNINNNNNLENNDDIINCNDNPVSQRAKGGFKASFNLNKVEKSIGNNKKKSWEEKFENKNVDRNNELNEDKNNKNKEKEFDNKNSNNDNDKINEEIEMHGEGKCSFCTDSNLGINKCVIY